MSELQKELRGAVSVAPDCPGVYVASSSLGALEALLGYLRSENTLAQRAPVAVSGAAIGPVTKQIVQEIAL